MSHRRRCKKSIHSSKQREQSGQNRNDMRCSGISINRVPTFAVSRHKSSPRSSVRILRDGAPFHHAEYRANAKGQIRPVRSSRVLITVFHRRSIQSHKPHELQWSLKRLDSDAHELRRPLANDLGHKPRLPLVVTKMVRDQQQSFVQRQTFHPSELARFPNQTPNSRVNLLEYR